MRNILAVLAVVAVVLTSFGVGETQLVRNDSYLEKFRDIDSTRIVSVAWNDIKGLNESTHPNPDLVLPGDVLQVPLGYSYEAQPNGVNHMWRAAVLFDSLVIQPYLKGVSSTNVPQVINKLDSMKIVADTDDDGMPLWPAILICAVVAGVIAAMILMSRKADRDRKFVPNPPNFKGCDPEQVTPVAQNALRRTLGPGITVVGPIESGIINGEMVMFNADGTSETVTFKDEPGFRTRVRFPDGQVRTVVCKWGCFNLCMSRMDARFTGTFRPRNAKSADVIPMADTTTVRAIEESIKGGEQTLSPDVLPKTEHDSVQEKTASEGPKKDESPDAAPSTATGKPDAEPAPATSKMRFTEIQVSPDRVTLKGEFDMDFGELMKVLNREAPDSKPVDVDKPDDKS